MMKTSDKLYQIPSWLADYCTTSRNSYADEVLENPVLLKIDNEGQSIDEYAIASCKYACLICKIPYEENVVERYLNIIPQTRDIFSEVFQNIIRSPVGDLVDIDKFKEAIDKNRECLLCNGTLKTACRHCNSTTEVECFSCRGEGSFPCVTCSKPDQCKICDGLGVVECKECVEGTTVCACVNRSSDEDLIIIKADNHDIGFKKELLKKYLGPLRGECYVTTTKNQIIIKKDNLWAAICTHGVDGICPKIELKNYVISN